MSLWIKICGITTSEAIAAAIEAGVDAVGFVFAASVRKISPERAATLCAGMPAGIVRVAVMHHPAQAEADAIIEAFRPDVLQTDLEDFTQLELPRELVRLPVCRPGQARPTPLPDRILCEGAASGTGTTTDWKWAHALARVTRVVLAGGLDSGNVAAAIATVRPFGIDVSSGVERAPGVKDPQRMFEFVAAARATEHRVERGE